MHREQDSDLIHDFFVPPSMITVITSISQSSSRAQSRFNEFRNMLKMSEGIEETLIRSFCKNSFPCSVTESKEVKKKTKTKTFTVMKQPLITLCISSVHPCQMLECVKEFPTFT